MRGVPALDASAMHAMEQLYDRCEAAGVQMVFSHVNEQPRHAMEKDGFIEFVGEENFRSNIIEAVNYAEELIK